MYFLLEVTILVYQRVLHYFMQFIFQLFPGWFHRTVFILDDVMRMPPLQVDCKDSYERGYSPRNNLIPRHA